MKNNVRLSYLPPGITFRFSFSEKRYRVAFCCSHYTLITDDVEYYNIPSIISNNLIVRVSSHGNN